MKLASPSSLLDRYLERRTTYLGCPYWKAPEVASGSDPSPSGDIWSLGITTIELLKQLPPYGDLHPMRVLFFLSRKPPPRLVGPYTRECKNFVQRCLQKDPARRPTADELLTHPFISNAEETSILTQLIKRKETWEVLNLQEDSDDSDSYPRSYSGSDSDSDNSGTLIV